MQGRSPKDISGAVPPTKDELLKHLTPLQLKFANFYLQGMTSKEAYKAAGYSAKGSDKVVWANSQTLLQSQPVRAYIDAHRKALSEQFTIDRHQFAEELKKAFLGQWEEEQVVVVNNGDYTSSPKIVKRSISTRDRLKAAEILERVFKIIDDTPSNQNMIETTTDKLMLESLSKISVPEVDEPDKNVVEYEEDADEVSTDGI